MPMRIQDADGWMQDRLIRLLLKYVFPVYCATDVEQFDYHFIGSGFFLNFGEKYFFIFTAHQNKIGLELPVFVPFDATDKGVHINRYRGYSFDDSDLAIFEIPDPTESFDAEKHAVLPLNFLKQPESFTGYQVICSGYPTILNKLDYNEKIIQPQFVGFVSDEFEVANELESITVNLNDVSFSEQSQIKNYEDLTQGFSGAPGFAITIGDNGKTGEIFFIGVASFTSSIPQNIYFIGTNELLSCLHQAYGIFDECEKADLTNQKKRAPQGEGPD